MDARADRLPPQNPEAEQSVLGAMLLDREAAYRAVDLLEAEDFYHPAHQLIFRAIAEVLEQGQAADAVTVAERLRARQELERAGGASYLASLSHAVPTAAHVEHYARIVAQLGLTRRLIAAATEIAREAYEGREDVETLLDRAEQRIFEIAQRHRQAGFLPLRDVLLETFERLEHLAAHKGGVIGVPTGFRKLDEMTAGLHPSELIVLAARPSVGKTTLSLNIAAHAARRGYGVAFFSLEMSRDQVAMRLLAAESGVHAHRLRTGFIGEEDWTRLTRAASRLSEMRFFVDDTPNISIMELRSRARRLRAEHQIGLVVVDYLQLMHTRGRAENRQQEIAEISRSLKALARELEIPVLALSQLSRAVEQREKQRPQLADLRESGAIEQDADVVVFLWKNPDDAHEAVLEAIVAKQRNGPTGSVKLVFLREFSRFADPELREEPA